MSADDSSSYRPKSPDLSFFSGPTEPPASAPPPAHSASPSAAPPPIDSSHLHQPHHQPHYHQHDQPTYTHHNPHQEHQPSSLDPYPQQHQQPPLPPNQQHQYPANPQPYDYPPNTQSAGYGYGSPSFAGAPYTHPTSPRGIKSEEQRPYFSPGPFPHNLAGHDLFHHQPHQPPFSQPYTDPSFPPFAGGGSYVPSYHTGEGIDQKPLPGADRKDIPLDHKAPMEQAQPPRPPPVNLPDPSPVKTKFPTARIKRIMQADEEVGKVAQQTPIAVGKALEMFMVQMVLTSADVAREKGSKRVTAQMLKQVVETDEQWDFLRDIVSKVETHDKGGKGGGSKAESDSDDDEPKKKKGGRKRKTG